MTESKRQTQVCEALRDILRSELRVRVEFDLQDRWDLVLKEAGHYSGGVYLGDPWKPIERRFGIFLATEQKRSVWPTITDAGEWERHAARHLTFDAVTRLILSEIDKHRLGEVHPGPSADAEAKAIDMIRAVAGDLDLDYRTFVGRTPIGKRFRGASLDMLWNRLRWVSDLRLPPLKQTDVTLFQGLAKIFARFIWEFVILVSVLFIWSNGIAAIVAAVAIGLVILLVVFAFILGRLDNRLPRGINTFEDLARELVRSQCMGRTEDAA